ncbi:MAG: phosphoribosylformylglycinamidine synthase subunit PurQ [Pseudomonadota bacterium]
MDAAVHVNARPQVLILAGDGINCERETARAFSLVGAESVILHINDLLEAPGRMKRFHALAIPGGFSFGDDLGSGQVLALKIRHHLRDELARFVEKHKAVIGICNGFQVLVRLGLLPYPFGNRVMALGPNRSGTFLNRWVGLSVNSKSPCIWTRDFAPVDRLELPMRNAEGRVVFREGREKKILRALEKDNLVVLRYREDVNGSYGRIAGVCDPTGLIFGVMPHPEAFLSNLLHPTLSQSSVRFGHGLGLRFFTSCIRFLRES